MGGSHDTDRDEVASAVLHGVGLGMALSALGILIIIANMFGDLKHIVANAVYGSTLVLLYLASTLYHSFTKGRAKYVFKIMDHSAIYLLIAGTYTPITVVFMEGLLGWVMFSVIWFLALFGIILKIFLFERVKKLSLLLYLLMGWLSLLALRPLIAVLSGVSLVFLFIGGLFYTAGIVFYVKKDLKYNHAIWHLFVLAGSMAHFFTILLNLIPV